MNSVCTYPGSYSELIIRRRQKPELSLAISRSLSIDGLAPCFFSN